MYINSKSDNFEYSPTSKKEKTISSSEFDSVLSEQKDQKVQQNSEATKVEEDSTERFYSVITYQNTKGMTEEDVNKYFPDKSEGEKSQILYMINISNNFSEDDVANEAIFEEAETKESLKQRQEFSIQLAKETHSFMSGTPMVSNVLRVSDEYLAAKKAGIDNPRALGIFMNDADAARYLNKDFGFNYNETKFTAEEAGNFLSTMLELTKQRMDESVGSDVQDEYTEAYQRYERLYNSYTSKLEDTNKYA